MHKRAVSGRLPFYMTKDAHDHKHFENIKVEKLPDSEAVITGELTLDYLNEIRPQALKSLNENAKIDGFRPGNIPENVLVQNFGEMRVLEEISEVALARAYGAILHEAKLSPIGRPEVSITKLAPGIPLEFRIKVVLEPEFVLPDYKKIAKESKGKEETPSVTEDEIEAVIKEIEKQKWDPKLAEGENLHDKVKENLLQEKKYRIKEKNRISIIESLTKATDVKIPNLMIESELSRMVHQFKEDVVRHGMKWEEYLKSIKKTEEDVRKEWTEKAAERSKAELIMAKIADMEKLEPAEEELEKEAQHIISHHKDADPMRVRIYVYQTLKTEKVLAFLESQ